MLHRLRHDLPFYSEHCLKIVNERGLVVPFVFRPAQLKVWRAGEAQRKAGRPVRLLILKSRRVGVSVSVQARNFHKATTTANRRALVVAHDTDTAGELFDISDVFFSHLPADAGEEFKPGLVSRRASPGGMKQLVFGEPSRARRARGELGVNSSLKIDTAKEVQAGRGKTITDLHATEVAFWPDPKKATSLLNAVFDTPDTFVALESTANGHNWFKARWDRAERGEGGFTAVFIGWCEDEQCWREFDDPDHRAQFVESIGTGEYGEDEPRLIEKFGCVPEQLLWRRTAIVDKCDGSLSVFRQEYPSTPLEAFVGSGKHVFSIRFIEQAEDDARSWDPPVAEEAAPLGVAQPGDGLLIPSGYRRREMRLSSHDVPTGTLWLPAGPAQAESGKALWRVWEHPDLGGKETDEAGRETERPPGMYVVFVDVAAGEEQTSSGESDWHAIQVIDHMSRVQVAQYRSRCDRDELAQEALLAGLYWNEALVAVETTGGLGLTVVETLHKRMRYRKLYRRRAQGSAKDKAQLMLGWDTNRKTKPAMEDEAAALLREGSHGIRSLALISEFKTYVRFDNGQRGADADAFDDLLMAWMGAQRIAQLIPPKVTRPKTRAYYNSMMRPTGRLP